MVNISNFSTELCGEAGAAVADAVHYFRAIISSVLKAGTHERGDRVSLPVV